MKIAHDRQIIRSYLNDARQHGQTIAFVPTMGNLHEGHLQLVRKAKQVADQVVVSIFVNPLQFGPSEDFSAYPRTLSRDMQRLEALDIAWVFAPDTTEIYGDMEDQTQVCVPKFSDQLCGAFRPTFFYGVTTIVSKLFNIIQPDLAIFGEKDFQQLFIIKKMVEDLSFPVQIESHATVREQDGLALSSRNQYLTSEERALAPKIYESLCSLRHSLLQGSLERTRLLQDVSSYLQQHTFKVDYLSIHNRHTLAIAQPGDKELVILIAAWLGKARLIDNVLVDL